MEFFTHILHKMYVYVYILHIYIFFYGLNKWSNDMKTVFFRGGGGVSGGYFRFSNFTNI